MRTLLRAVVETNSGNKSVADGSLPRVIKETMDRLKPEATYFFTVDGNRSCMMVFDLQDPSEIPGIAEPLFNVLNAKVDFIPVMNAEDLQKGLMAYRKMEMAEAQ
jgi:hypothetical protein